MEEDRSPVKVPRAQVVQCIGNANLFHSEYQVFELANALGMDASIVRSLMVDPRYRGHPNEVAREILFRFADIYTEDEKSFVEALLLPMERARCKGAYYDILKIDGISLNGHRTSPSLATKMLRLDMQEAICFLSKYYFTTFDLGYLMDVLGIESQHNAGYEMTNHMYLYGYRSVYIMYMMRALDLYGTRFFPLQLQMAMETVKPEGDCNYTDLLQNHPKMKPLYSSVVRMTLNAKD